MARGRPRKTQDDVLMKSAEMMGWALGGLEREIIATKERLAALSAQAAALRARVPAVAARVRSAMDADAPAAGPGRRRRKRRAMSREARQKISEMMKKRWAERKKSK